MKNLYNILVLFSLALCFIAMSSGANAGVPITTDSRIKTLVYNENEVFHLTLHYGYQSNIEFANNEEIETLSVGNSYSWKITPVGRRLFIKALEGSAKTNMTVITNKRTYQFEIESKDPDAKMDEELVYVVRFFYPSESFDSALPKIDSAKFAPPPIKNTPVKKDDNFNFNYSLTGPDSIAPTKVFDDGKQLFLKFPNNNANLPNFYIPGDKGVETRVSFSRQGEFIVIKQMITKMTLKLGKDVVHIFNEGIK